MKADQYKSIVILTGAGISAESGIKTFRDSDGLWENHRMEEVATPEAFAQDPVLVHRFYNRRRRQLVSGDIHPNPAHRAVAEFENQADVKVLLVTQNIDNLHEQAGSRNLIHLHGEILKAFCIKRGNVISATGDLSCDDVCACCDEPGNLRPDIVWFGEMPRQLDRIYDALSSCDLFIAIGTSGNVYPAAGFVEIANEAGAHTVELNLEPSSVESMFKEKIYGLASKIVTEYLNN